MQPKCGKQEEDFDYTLISLDTNELPIWIEFDAKDRMAKITRNGVYNAANGWGNNIHNEMYSFELLISIDGTDSDN